MSSFVSRYRSLHAVREQHEAERREQEEFISSHPPPSWPPAPTEKKRGRATRVLQTPEPSTANDTLFNSVLFKKTTDAREVEKDEAAKAMEANRSGAMGRLQDKTQSLDQWMHHTGGKKKPLSTDPASPARIAFENHSSGTLIAPEPLVLRGKVRKGMQNPETTGIIEKGIRDREERRERAIHGFEAGRSFHSLFSEQPKIPHGTAHVKQQEDRLNTMISSNNNNNQLNNDPLLQLDSPAGFPGVGQVAQSRLKHRLGKHQYRTAHQQTTASEFFGGYERHNNNNSNHNNNNLLQQENNNNNNTSSSSYLPGIHRKAPDGSRGLKIDQQRSQQPDSVKLAFESNPTPIRGRSQFSTTSSSWGNPGAAGELKDFVSGNTRQGPNTRHFSQGNNYGSSQFPPVGTASSVSGNNNTNNSGSFNPVYGGGSAGTSSFFRSRTPFPVSSTKNRM